MHLRPKSLLGACEETGRARMCLEKGVNVVQRCSRPGVARVSCWCCDLGPFLLCHTRRCKVHEPCVRIRLSGRYVFQRLSCTDSTPQLGFNKDKCISAIGTLTKFTQNHGWARRRELQQCRYAGPTDLHRESLVGASWPTRISMFGSPRDY